MRRTAVAGPSRTTAASASGSSLSQRAKAAAPPTRQAAASGSRPPPAKSANTARAASANAQPPPPIDSQAQLPFIDSQTQSTQPASSQAAAWSLNVPGSGVSPSLHPLSLPDEASIANVVQLILTQYDLRPVFASTSSVTPTQASIQQRLLSLAQLYHTLTPPDYATASFYSLLSLALDTTCVASRYISADCALSGALPFPFASPPSSTPLTAPSQASPSRASAHAAIEMLEKGTKETFKDVRSARVYARACGVLGRYEDAEGALRWATRSAAEANTSPSSTNATLPTEDYQASPPPLLPLASVEAAHASSQLAEMALRSGRARDATKLFERAFAADAFSWAAWCGRCEQASDPPAHHAWPGTLGAQSPGACFARIFLDKLRREGLGVGPGGSVAWLHSASAEDDVGPSLSQASTLPGASQRSRSGQSVTRATSAAAARKAPAAGNFSMSDPYAGTSSIAEDVGSESMPLPARPLARPGAARAPPTLSASQSTYVRPGSRPAAGVTSGVKRMRGGAPEPRAASSTRPAPGAAAKPASMLGSALARSNEQARPASSQSGSTVRGGVVTEDEKAGSQTRRATRLASGAAAGVGARKVPPARGARAPTPPKSTAGAARKPPTLTRSAPSTSSDGPEPAPTRATLDALKLREALKSACDAAAAEASRTAAYWSDVNGEVLELLRTLGETYGAVCRHLGRKALWLLRPKTGSASAAAAVGEGVSAWRDEGDRRRGSIPAWLRDTPPVRSLLGLAAREVGAYALAEQHFTYARSRDASLVAHMDVLSTVLFHLNREVALSALAAELLLIDPNSAVAHVAAGNAFSLQREHGVALRCFRRACLAAPGYAYAYALAGHEAKALEQPDRAVAFYRAAIRADQRHWNAWAGIAEVYDKGQQWDLAEYHWGMALRINVDNAVLWDLYGRCQESLRNIAPARQAFERALLIDAKSPMTRLRLAQLHASQGDHEKAHEQLVQTLLLAPDEPTVHLELAKSYMRLGEGAFATISSTDGVTSTGSTQLRAKGNVVLPQRHAEAIAHHLCAAIDLEPRLAREIKAMGEGAKAALRGAKRLNDGADETYRRDEDDETSVLEDAHDDEGGEEETGAGEGSTQDEDAEMEEEVAPRRVDEDSDMRLD